MVEHPEPPAPPAAETAAAPVAHDSEAELRELMPHALRGDLVAIDRVLDILEARRRGEREEWMRWFWTTGEGGPRTPGSPRPDET
ncbi:MAG: hypothetical protein MUE66_00300 [Acidimicrobiia bacterium]|jgi:hypothetical protein|nr:hypothetical protein [Acidimicrobiia bacterium]MCU0935479.1 hypothetical protein [Gammaproteobacteria bacterium]